MSRVVKYPTKFWQFGRLSNYPWCCVIAFYLRKWLYVDTGLLRKVWDRFGSPKTKVGYIQCPVHMIATRVFGWRPKHHKCEECGWDQLGSGPCRVENLHETWVVESVKQSYRWQLQKNGVIYFRQPGRIAQRIESQMDPRLFKRLNGIVD